MWEVCRDKVVEAGTDVRMSTAVVRIEHAGGSAHKVEVAGADGVDRLPATQVISSMPLSALVKAMDPPPPAEVLEAVLDRTGYLAELGASTDPQDESRVENLAELVGVAREFSERSPEGGVAAFMEQVSLVADADQILVLEDGAVVGLGTHESLLATCPTYVEIVESQLRAEVAS